MNQSVRFEQTRTQEEVYKKIHTPIVREILDYLWYFARVFVIVSLSYIFIKTSVFRSFMVEGKSMFPNYDSGQVVYVNKIAPKIGDIARGDTVVIDRKNEDCPTVSGKSSGGCFYIKRIIGLPGEQVKIEDGEVYIINQKYPEGVKLNETNYLKSDVKTYKNLHADNIKFISEKIPEKHYFLMGDNRPYSSDSRVFSFVPIEDIQGKEFFKKENGFFKLPKYNISNVNQ